jgi:hypothetical protein
MEILLSARSSHLLSRFFNANQETDMYKNSSCDPLVAFLKTVPGVKPSMGQGVFEDGTWWVKFQIDIGHPLAWQVVQEMGHVLNYVSISEPLPTIFKPVSPPPYMNGGPEQFLSWVIESTEKEFSPALCAEWLSGRMPRPIDDLSQWAGDDSDDDE